jgi:hypothetical protein
MTKREIKAVMRDIVGNVDIENLQALYLTTTLDYCTQRMKECVITGALDEVITFAVLRQLHLQLIPGAVIG